MEKLNKMKNIHILSTKKPSKIGYIFESESYHIFTNGENPNDIADNLACYRNIYITNDKEIKKGDWYLNNGHLLKCTELKIRSSCKKIILTTDQDLIKDGVQAIEDEFLEWFIENPSCEKVETKTFEVEDYVGFAGHTAYPTFHKEYKIILPKEIGFKVENGKRTETYYEKEEPKQETIEEAARNYSIYNEQINKAIQEAVIFGAKLQEEKTIEEVFQWLTTKNYLTDLKETLIKEFKNK